MIFLYVLIGALCVLFLTLLYGQMTNKKLEMPTAGGIKNGAIGFADKNNLARFSKNNGKDLDKLFRISKNPWKITPSTFQLIRYGFLIGGLVLAFGSYFLEPLVSIIPLLIGVLGFVYPMQVYRDRANDRISQWNRFYQYVWVLTNNASMYDPQQTFLNTGAFIKENNPRYTELVQAFKDFYRFWNPNDIHPEIIRNYFDIPIAREVYQIMASMANTGVFPKEQLAAFRIYIANEQSKYTEQVLSGVSAKATMASLPFLMLSAIVAIAVPMIFTALSYL